MSPAEGLEIALCLSGDTWYSWSGLSISNPCRDNFRFHGLYAASRRASCRIIDQRKRAVRACCLIYCCWLSWQRLRRPVCMFFKVSESCNSKSSPFPICSSPFHLPLQAIFFVSSSYIFANSQDTFLLSFVSGLRYQINVFSVSKLYRPQISVNLISFSHHGISYHTP